MSKYFNKEKFNEIIEGLKECAKLPPEILMKSATEIYLSSAAESQGESEWKIVENGCMVKVTSIVECKECGHRRGRFVADVLDFCPACGKSMREK